jgi:hypothetical protein
MTSIMLQIMSLTGDWMKIVHLMFLYFTIGMFFLILTALKTPAIQ